MAMSDTVGTLTFYPSAVLDGQEWPWSGSVCEPGPNLLNERWKWGNGYTVPSTTLEAFCTEYNVSPDFIHIDVQGAEYKVFSAIGNLRPSIVWAEISEFHMYKTGTTYDGNVKLYSIKKTPETLSNKIFLDTDLTQFINTKLFELSFTGLTKDDSINFINQFIQGVNNGKININGYMSYPSQNGSNLEDQFPFIFRPTKNTTNTYLGATIDSGVSGLTSFNIIVDFFSKIKLSPANKEFGFGLVWDKNVLGQQETLKTSTIESSSYKSNPVTYGALGGDFLYLLSHKSVIPTKGDPIDLKGTLYGIPQPKFTDEIINKTDPMVRGDQLMDLINLIVKFLVSHVHAFPGLAPVPVGTDGTSSQDIIQKLLDADKTILNQNIRIN
jgi:hypothetical protein